MNASSPSAVPPRMPQLLPPLLLVDDEEGIRKVLALTLGDAGFQVHTAATGEEALRRFQELRPEIVVTDIKMPGMDGLEMLRRLKTMSPDTEVIMITGHGDLDLAIQSIKLDATDFVTKPINEAILEIALDRARQRLALRREIRGYTENLERLVLEKSRQLVAAERFAAVGQTAASLAHAIRNIAAGLEGAVFLLDPARLSQTGQAGQAGQAGQTGQAGQAGRAGSPPDPDDERAAGFAMLRDNIDRVKALMRDLLRLGDERPPQPRPEDPEAPARDVTTLLAHRALETGVELVLEAGAGPDPVALDAGAIHQCLMNLVANALEAVAAASGSTADAPRRVTLRVERQGRFLVYRVADTGPGVPEAFREKLFTAFASERGGAGVGLMASRRLAQAHGGDLELESTGPTGSVFVLRLPLRGGPATSTPEGTPCAS